MISQNPFISVAVGPGIYSDAGSLPGTWVALSVAMHQSSSCVLCSMSATIHRYDGFVPRSMQACRWRLEHFSARKKKPECHFPSHTRRSQTIRIFQESDRIGTGVPPSDSKLGAVVSRRESLGQRAREKGLGKHPVMYEREEETGVPLRDATCFELKVREINAAYGYGVKTLGIKSSAFRGISFAFCSAHIYFELYHAAETDLCPIKCVWRGFFRATVYLLLCTPL